MTNFKTGLIALVLAGGAVGITAQAASAHGGSEAGKPRLNFEQMDADGDGKITEAELAAHRQARFADQDSNGDGALSRAEILAVINAKMAAKMANRVDKMFERKDADGNGMISEIELSGGQSERFFKRLDKDGDGAVSKAELDAAMKKRKGRRADHGQASE